MDKIDEGQIIYLKLTGQAVMALADFNKRTRTYIECRYMDNLGVYHEESFYPFELVAEKP